MKAAKLTHQQALTMLAKNIPPGTKLISAAMQKWDVAIVVKDCGQLNGRFPKSIDKNVNDNSKKNAVLRALSELYSAVCQEDYQSELDQSGVGCKAAHSFPYQGNTHKVWELKPNNKDRVYFYALKDGMPDGRKVLFLLSAYHKKDQKTPQEIKDVCEEDIKVILQSRGKIELCEENHVAKK
jgi:hypothetical protein